MVFCPKCNCAYNENINFCPTCGEAMIEIKTQPVVQDNISQQQKISKGKMVTGASLVFVCFPITFLLILGFVSLLYNIYCPDFSATYVSSPVYSLPLIFSLLLISFPMNLVGLILSSSCVKSGKAPIINIFSRFVGVANLIVDVMIPFTLIFLSFFYL